MKRFDWAALLAQHLYLSLDVFDTALVRLVSQPVDVFSFVERSYRAARPNAAAFTFADERVAAERRARSQQRAYGGSDEISLDDIYAELSLPADWSAAELRELELDSERALTKRNDQIYDVYREALRRGLSVIFVSDMYLPPAVISDLLHRNGYVRYEHLFVSGALGLNKSRGTLWPHVVKELGVRPQDILHIGDHQHADVATARAAGLSAVHYNPRVPAAVSTQSDCVESLHRGLVRKKLVLDSSADPFDFWYRLGYEVAGILYLGFVQWLFRVFARDGIDHVFFLSRDGYILQKVYERLLRAGAAGVPSSYLFASRRALVIPAIRDLDEQTLNYLVASKHPLTVSQYLSRAGLNPMEHLTDIAEVGFSGVDASVSRSEQYGRLRHLFRRLEEPLLSGAAAERSRLLSYLEQEGVFAAQRPAFVDIGWNGSSLAALNTLASMTRSACRPAGYYLGTFEPTRRLEEQQIQLRGWLCEHGRPIRLRNLIRSCIEIFEFLHLAPHSGVIGFELDGSSVVPVMGPDDANAAKHAAAERVQRGALDYIEDFLNVTASFQWLTVRRNDAVAPIARLIERPTYREASLLGELMHVDGFGPSSNPWPIAKPSVSVRDLRAPLLVYRDYRRAFWKEGYAVRFFGDHHYVYDAMRLVRDLRWGGPLQRIRRPQGGGLYLRMKDTFYNTMRAISPNTTAAMSRWLGRGLARFERRLIIGRKFS